MHMLKIPSALILELCFHLKVCVCYRHGVSSPTVSEEAVGLGGRVVAGMMVLEGTTSLKVCVCYTHRVSSPTVSEEALGGRVVVGMMVLEGTTSVETFRTPVVSVFICMYVYKKV